MNKAFDETDTTKKTLGAIRLRAALALAWERFWPLILPTLGVISTFLIISWFGFWPVMHDWLRLAVLSLLACGLFLTLPKLRAFRWPQTQEVTDRIEQISQFRHRPLNAQSDELAE